jgi:hypothetical protein
MQTVHTKESIHELLDKSDAAVIRALYAIYNLQTASEQAGHSTREVNGVGFSQFDAPFLTDMVLKSRRWGSLTPKQMAVTRNKIKRYHRQLVEIANSRLQHAASADEAQQTATVSTDRPAYVSHCQCENYDGERKCGWCQTIEMKNEFSRQEARQEARAHLDQPDDRYSHAGQF